MSRSLWVFDRVLTGHEMNGEISGLPDPLRSMAEHLARVEVDEALTGQARREALAAARAPLWKAMLAARADRESLVDALAAIDPEGPPPEAETAARPATLADIRKIKAGLQ